MKKTKTFFITLLVAVCLLGFSGTSHAFDLSKITSKPVQFAKYIAQKLGFGDKNEEEIQKTESDKDLTVKDPSESSYNPLSNQESSDLDLSENEYTRPGLNDEIMEKHGWQAYREKVNLNYNSEDWYLKISAGTGERISPFSYDPSDIPAWKTKAEYNTELPWESLSHLSAEVFLESALSRQHTFGLNDSGTERTNETFNFSPDYLGYGLRINALVKDAKIGLYGWYRDDVKALSPDPFSKAQMASSDYLWRALNSDYYQGNNNLAATISYDLPFMNFFHQGMSPTVRLETAYRFAANKYEKNNLIEDYDQWKVGMAYEGNNHIDWLSPYGINWGVGYNYTVTLDDINIMDNLRQGHGSHSGNINANTYWFNMKLYTMVMYLYDRETRGSMAVLNATYSPDWRWSYGIKANFYSGKKENDGKALNENSDLVTFTASYRWD